MAEKGAVAWAETVGCMGEEDSGCKSSRRRLDVLIAREQARASSSIDPCRRSQRDGGAFMIDEAVSY
jgi:hypothetical protein